jgi:hypothetical protein
MPASMAKNIELKVGDEVFFHHKVKNCTGSIEVGASASRKQRNKVTCCVEGRQSGTRETGW